MAFDPLDRRDIAAAAARIKGKPSPASDRFSKYADDPVGFAVDVLGLRLWSHQRRALEAVRDNRRVAWRSCHGSGKTTTVGALVLWYIETRPGALVIVTARSFRQVKSSSAA